jgi:hypothetical protein
MSDGPSADDFRAKVFRDREHRGDWRVEKLNDNGGSIEVAIFSGEDRQRALRYADREYGGFDEVELEPYRPSSEVERLAALDRPSSELRLIRDTVRRWFRSEPC